MKTTQKIALARMLYRAVRTGRAIVGKTDWTIVKRNGARYELDLSEGIDFAIYLGGIYERQTRSRLLELIEPGSLVLDIGANVGAHTLPMAQRVGPKGRVLAFEPTSFAVQKLRRTLTLNPSLSERVEVHHCYLSEQDGGSVPAAIHSSWPLEGAAGKQHEKHLGSEMATGAADARSLDSVIRDHETQRVQLVKIDVDGHESAVLKGASNMLREMRPILVMELAPYVLEENGTSLAELLSLILPYEYKLYHERTMERLPISASAISSMIGDGASINVVARQ